MPASLAVLGLLLASCTNGEKRPGGATRAADPSSTPADSPAPASPPQARLVVVTDLQGYLEPCGCQSRPLGGIDRAAAQIAQLRADGVPTVVLSVGELFFEAAGATAHADHADRPQGGETQEIWKAEVLADVLKGLSVAGSLLGAGDDRFGVELRDKLVERAALRALAPQGEGSTAIVEAGGLRLGLWAARLSPELDPAAAAATVAAQAKALRAQGAAVVLGLVDADARSARRLAGRALGTDLVFNGGLQREAPDPPAQLGPASLLTGAQHGRGLLVVDLHTGGEGPARDGAPMADGSPWTRAHRREAQHKTINALSKRIADWEKQKNVDGAQLAEQRARLQGLKQELAALAKPPPATGRRFVARFIELSPDVAQDAATTAVMAGYDRRVNAHNRSAFADHRPEVAPKGTPHYVGSAKCGSCHAPALAWWKQHPHGRAYATLQKRHKEYNLSCVGCHVTGYEKPGGSTVTHNDGLTNVGCESCHGPGSMHRGDKANIARSPQQEVCVACHNAEHSDGFEFELYRSQLMAPGHGKPLPTE